MKKLLFATFLLSVGVFVFGQEAGSFKDLIASGTTKRDFVLASDHFTANILVDPDDSKTVLLAAGLFSDDVERITGHKPDVKNKVDAISSDCVIIGSIEGSDIIKKLIKKKKIDIAEIKGKWESCLIQVVNNPLPGVDRALVIAGSDRRGTAYGVFELSKQMGVSPWYYFADVVPKKRDDIYIKEGRYVQESPSVKYRGIFINDEVWGLRPWAMYTYAPEEGKGLGPSTYSRIFELLLRLKANLLWPAMMHQTKPFNYYEENKKVADKYGIVMGSSHIEPMLRNSIEGAEWDAEYPDEPWNYTINRKHIYEYWEKRIKENGKYDNVYTQGKRGQDDVAGSEITVPVLEQIFEDQRNILTKHVNSDITEVPQVLIAYTEVLDLYNEGLKVPDDIIICWPDDNFGYIRQLPDSEEQRRPGGSGVYYHYQWTNGATNSHSWLYTTPPALTWMEMKKAYDLKVNKLWVLHAADIKFHEIGIEHFMQMAWNMSDFEANDPEGFLKDWAGRDFGPEYASEIAEIMDKHFELAYARRPENMVMYYVKNKRLPGMYNSKNINWDWFSLENYKEVQNRIEAYEKLLKKVEKVYESVPYELKDAFFQMVVYNVKGAALHNLKVLNAQKSIAYGKEQRSSAAFYAAKAQIAENELFKLIDHYNRDQVIVKDKWDHMASLPGPWGGQWHQWDMPPLSTYSGKGLPSLRVSPEGGDSISLPGFSVFNRDRYYIDLYNPGNGAVYWVSQIPEEWILLSETSGVIYDEKRLWVTIDWDKVPEGEDISRYLNFSWYSSLKDEWVIWEDLTPEGKEAYMSGTLVEEGSAGSFNVRLSLFNPSIPSSANFKGFVESNGYISLEAESFTRKTGHNNASWEIIEGLGRTGNSVSVLPVTLPAIDNEKDIVMNSPVLEYDIYTFSEGAFPVVFNCIPSFAINEEYGLRIAVAVDDNLPEIVSNIESHDEIENMMKLKMDLNIKNKRPPVLKV